PAYTFLLLHNTFFYEKDFSSPMCDLRYKAELVGWQTYGQRLEVDLRNEEKATPPNRELIDRYAFIIGVGCESRARDTFSQESAERLWNSAADYYRKMDFSDSFVSLSRPRLAELRLQHAIETKKDSNQKWQSAELASALKAYQVISCFTTESSKAESAIAALRVFTLLNAKAAACPADALNALFSPEEAEKLETALLPFEPQSVDLITMPIVESTYGLSHRFSRKTLTRNLYACRHFEFLYRLKTEYPSELLSALCFDPDVLEKLVARLTPQVLSEACAERIFLYLYMTQGKVPKKQMPRVLSACEKLLESSVSGQAAYTLYCLYSGEGGVKKDMAKAYAALIQGMEKRYPDAVYETALLAKKGKLAAFGIAKTEYRTYLKLAAELGHPEAQKKLG
ncbi:MAG: sel1 repeat family protein, partial [Clostridia bacterium]|nr:sel1 repeat family protein [Clostridia bacterium]